MHAFIIFLINVNPLDGTKTLKSMTELKIKTN